MSALINADFTKRVVITPGQYRWVASPQPGVERMMLDRIGDEQARATSLVRYAKGSYFPAHVHPGGEEILVLSGAFSEHGCDYPAGWYLRSPPGSHHRPSSVEGALIFVKLRQMRSSETEAVRIDTNDARRWTTRDGRAVCALYGDGFEQVGIQRVPEGSRVLERLVRAAELFVLMGELQDADEHYAPGTWIRLTQGFYPKLVAGRGGAVYYFKTGHHPIGEP